MPPRPPELGVAPPFGAPPALEDAPALEDPPALEEAPEPPSVPRTSEFVLENVRPEHERRSAPASVIDPFRMGLFSKNSLNAGRRRSRSCARVPSVQTA
jgi:hypothetical protein